MPELSPISIALWAGLGVLLVAGALLVRRRGQRAHLRSLRALSLRLGLQLDEDGQAVSGRLAGREVRAWVEHPPRARDEGATFVRVDLLGVFPAAERLDAALLAAWVEEAGARERGGPSVLSPEASAQLAGLSPHVQALLEDPGLRSRLLAFLRANHRAWIERGQLHVCRRLRLRKASVLESFVEEALALAVALSSATHGSRRLERAG